MYPKSPPRQKRVRLTGLPLQPAGLGLRLPHALQDSIGYRQPVYTPQGYLSYLARTNKTGVHSGAKTALLALAGNLPQFGSPNLAHQAPRGVLPSGARAGAAWCGPAACSPRGPSADPPAAASGLPRPLPPARSRACCGVIRETQKRPKPISGIGSPILRETLLNLLNDWFSLRNPTKRGFHKGYTIEANFGFGVGVMKWNPHGGKNELEPRRLCQSEPTKCILILIITN